jgi:uncharacterized LabA/DUF88 family protein
MKRICVFIDGSNFYFALKRNNRVTRVDYHQLSLALVGPDRELVRTYYYNVAYDKSHHPEQAQSQQPFLDALDKTPLLTLRLGRLIPFQDGGAQERGMDVLMASDLVFYASQNLFDTAIVITEDPDFSIPLNYVKELGKHVEIAVFNDGQGRELMRTADFRLPLDAVLNKFAAKIFPAEEEDDNIGNSDDQASLLKKILPKGKGKKNS